MPCGLDAVAGTAQGCWMRRWYVRNAITDAERAW